MRVTEVNVRLVDVLPLDGADGLLAYASITLDGELAIKGIRLVRVRGRILASMPGREQTRECTFCKSRNFVSHHRCKDCGEILERVILPGGHIFSDVVHPMNQRLRDYIEDELIQVLRGRLNGNNHLGEGS